MYIHTHTSLRQKHPSIHTSIRPIVRPCIRPLADWIGPAQHMTNLLYRMWPESEQNFPFSYLQPPEVSRSIASKFLVPALINWDFNNVAIAGYEVVYRDSYLKEDDLELIKDLLSSVCDCKNGLPFIFCLCAPILTNHAGAWLHSARFLTLVTPCRNESDKGRTRCWITPCQLWEKHPHRLIAELLEMFFSHWLVLHQGGWQGLTSHFNLCIGSRSMIYQMITYIDTYFKSQFTWICPMGTSISTKLILFFVVWICFKCIHLNSTHQISESISTDLQISTSTDLNISRSKHFVRHRYSQIPTWNSFTLLGPCSSCWDPIKSAIPCGWQRFTPRPVEGSGLSAVGCGLADLPRRSGAAAAERCRGATRLKQGQGWQKGTAAPGKSGGIIGSLFWTLAKRLRLGVLVVFFLFFFCQSS